MRLVGVHSMNTDNRKPIMSNFKLFMFDCDFVAELIHANQHNEVLKNRLFGWLNEEWSI